MAATTTIEVPHLGGIKVGYHLSGGRYDGSKSTVVLINSMCTTVSLYREQFSNTKLTDVTNLLAIEPLGHGATSAKSEHWTYWDTATMALQVMDKLGIQKAFALGTSQGGWIVVRMALLAPERILGIIPLGTSMDSESADSRTKNCWDPFPIIKPFYEMWSSATETPNFAIDERWCGLVATLGFGNGVPPEMVEFWKSTVRDVYRGDEGRRKARMACICLLERDSLLLRLSDVKCPVYWLQGTEDVPFGQTVPTEQIKLFAASKEAKLIPVQGGAHYLNATNPIEVADAILEMVEKHR